MSQEPPTIRTARLELVPAGLRHLDAELASPAALGALLGARIPTGWPPGEYDRDAVEHFRARLAADPAAAGWYGWYAIDRSVPVVIGAAGFHGPPDRDGTVEIGYSIVEEFRGAGYAAEIVRALLTVAWANAAVVRVVARAQPGNRASVKVLEGAGFARAGPGDESGTVGYAKPRPA